MRSDDFTIAEGQLDVPILGDDLHVAIADGLFFGIFCRQWEEYDG
ncbi:MAG: hypothetical protein PHE53_11845 [Thermoguttaceae bacterium]|nr:hypothetical protein [Thermoguttaceae bacterium]